MKPILLIGNGGQAKVVKEIIDLSDEYELKGYLTDDITEYHKEENLIYDNLKNIHLYKAEYVFHIAIGNNYIRKRLFNRLAISIEQFPVLRHPSAIVSSSAKIENGTVVMANSVINAETSIGKHNIINTGSIIEHDNVIKDYVHISPNSTLTGGVEVGEASQIGASATVLPALKIGDDAIVGAGATVVNHVENHQIVVGTPAKPIRR